MLFCPEKKVEKKREENETEIKGKKTEEKRKWKAKKTWHAQRNHLSVTFFSLCKAQKKVVNYTNGPPISLRLHCYPSYYLKSY